MIFLLKNLQYCQLPSEQKNNNFCMIIQKNMRVFFFKISTPPPSPPPSKPASWMSAVRMIVMSVTIFQMWHLAVVTIRYLSPALIPRAPPNQRCARDARLGIFISFHHRQRMLLKIYKVCSKNAAVARNYFLVALKINRQCKKVIALKIEKFYQTFLPF